MRKKDEEMFTLENRGCIIHLFWLSDMFSQKNDVMGLKYIIKISSLKFGEIEVGSKDF